jgi:hypothetical protein
VLVIKEGIKNHLQWFQSKGQLRYTEGGDVWVPHDQKAYQVMISKNGDNKNAWCPWGMWPIHRMKMAKLLREKWNKTALCECTHVHAHACSLSSTSSLFWSENYGSWQFKFHLHVFVKKEKLWFKLHFVSTSISRWAVTHLANYSSTWYYTGRENSTVVMSVNNLMFFTSRALTYLKETDVWSCSALVNTNKSLRTDKHSLLWR